MKQNNDRQFDCIKMKDEIQSQVYVETRNMTKAELLFYFNESHKVDTTSCPKQSRENIFPLL